MSERSKPETEAPRYADRLGGAPHSKQSLRLWLRLLSCCMVAEKRLRKRFEQEFGITLARFDVLAALERRGTGLRMSELSESLMVSNGNVTGVVARLIEDGLVSRTVDRSDRRSATIRLTRKGRESFARMALAHERWVERFCAGLSDQQVEELMRLLAALRHSIETNPI